jgi:hypothetical protein
MIRRSVVMPLSDDDAGKLAVWSDMARSVELVSIGRAHNLGIGAVICGASDRQLGAA